MQTRRDVLTRCGAGLAAIIAAGKAPAAVVRSMMGARGVMTSSSSLPYDHEVEWLETTGVQYIDSKIIADSNISIETKIYRKNADGIPIFGAYNTDGNLRYHADLVAGLDFYYGQSSTLYQISNSIWNYPVDIKCLVNEHKLYLNDRYIDLPTIDFSTGLNFYIGARNVNGVGQVSSNNNIRIYYFQMLEHSTLVRDFIPVVDYNGVACMYDKVTGHNFYNANNFKTNEDA